MASTKRRYSKEEFARRGDAVYDNEVRPQLKAEDEGKLAAIDIESGRTRLMSMSSASSSAGRNTSHEDCPLGGRQGAIERLFG